eukprot:scaffold530_cov107-Cylindrotheca_fusiformis.AAC.4
MIGDGNGETSFDKQLLPYNRLTSGFMITPIPRPNQQQNVCSVASQFRSNSKISTRIFQMPNEIQQEEDRYLELALKSEGVLARPEVVYVIMYNPGTDQEGIHTMEFPRGEETDLLLAFESIEDCVNFSNKLRQDPNWHQEPIPTPTPFDQVEVACQQMSLPIKIVPNQLG